MLFGSVVEFGKGVLLELTPTEAVPNNDMKSSRGAGQLGGIGVAREAAAGRKLTGGANAGAVDQTLNRDRLRRKLTFRYDCGFWPIIQNSQ
jgi:hypothetical protein